MKDRIISGYVTKAYDRKAVTEDGEEVLTGIVEGYLATWDVDRANDRFMPGSFAESIAELRQRGRALRLKRNHWGDLIGGFNPEKLKEDSRGLFGVAEINLLVQEGREAYALAKQGVLVDFSVGFSANVDDVDMEDNVRIFKKATLWETSLVDEPMNPKAEVTAVRAATSHEQLYIQTARVVKEHGGSERVPFDVVQAVNKQYAEFGDFPSPFERGQWSWSEITALPKSLRGYIIGKERLSREAVGALVKATLSADSASAEEVGRMLKGMTEEKMEDLRKLLGAKAESCRLMGEIIDDDEDEDAMGKFRGMVDEDVKRNLSILAMIMDEEEEDSTEEEKQAAQELTATLKGAFND